MQDNLFRKCLVVGIIVLLVGVIVAPSINAITHKITTRINCKDEVKSNKGELVKTKADEIDVIFNNMKKKLDNVNTQQECNIIFKEALIELDKCGLLGSISVDDAYKLVSSSANNENSYSVSGESTQTYFLEFIGVFFHVLSEYMWYLFGVLWFLISQMFLFFINHPVHIGSWIFFGELHYIAGSLYDANPAEGYIKIVSSEGETEYNSFYGHLDFIEYQDHFDPRGSFFYCIGIKGFKGMLIDNYYFGTAKEVNIGTNTPDPYYI